MASTDTVADNTAFAEKNDANFPILSDPDKSVSASYGVLSDRGFAKRWTYYIDETGVVRRIDRFVKPATAGSDLARNLRSLGVAEVGE